MSYNKLKILFQEQSLLNDINGILSWDMATYMPKNSRSQRVKQIKKIYDYKKSIFNIGSPDIDIITKKKLPNKTKPSPPT